MKIEKKKNNLAEVTIEKRGPYVHAGQTTSEEEIFETAGETVPEKEKTVPVPRTTKKQARLQACIENVNFVVL